MGIRRLLNFIIGAQWEGGEAVAKAKGDLKGLEQETKNAGGGIGSSMDKAALAAGVFSAGVFAAGQAAKAAWKAINEGAAMAGMNQQLTAAAANIGITTDVLNNQLRNALKGTVTDAEATKLALKAIADGATTIPEITAAVVAQAEAMGLLVNGTRTAAGEFEALTNKQQNFIDTAKQAAAVDISTTFGGGGSGGYLDQQIQQEQKRIELQLRLNALVGSGITTYADYAAIQSDLQQRELAEAEAAIQQAEAKRALETAIAAVDIKLGQYIGYLDRAAAAAGRTTASVWTLRDALSGLSQIGQLQYLAQGYGGPNVSPDRFAAGREGNALVAAREQARIMGTISEEAGRAQTRELQAWNRTQKAIEETTDATYGYASSIITAEEAMMNLQAATGSMFDQARRMTEFNPAEYYYKQLLEAGAGAQQLKDALITSGLESPERAEEIFNLAQRMQAIQNVAQQTVAGGIPVAMGWQAAQATADNVIAGQYAGATINQGGYQIAVNFNGDVIDPETITALIDQALLEAYQAGGGTP